MPSKLQNSPWWSMGSGDSSRRTMTSTDSFSMAWSFSLSRPNSFLSVTSALGPTPRMARPRVRWSRKAMRSATWNGWWNGVLMTEVPRRMRLAWAAALASASSGAGMFSQPPEWCSPMKNSSKSSSSA